MHYKKNKRTVQKELYDEIELCDVCKKEIIRYRMNYDVNDVRITARIGTNYPECDGTTTYELDICSDCFMKKVKPLIEHEFNVQFQEYDTDDPPKPQDLP